MTTPTDTLARRADLRQGGEALRHAQLQPRPNPPGFLFPAAGSLAVTAAILPVALAIMMMRAIFFPIWSGRNSCNPRQR